MNAGRVHVLAGQEEVWGLALAGVGGTVCVDEKSSREALGKLDLGSLALLLVSTEVADWSAEALRRVEETSGGPLVLVLPDGRPT